MYGLNITPAIKYLNIVIPAKAGIQEGTGFRIKSGMTELYYLIARFILLWHQKGQNLCFFLDNEKANMEKDRYIYLSLNSILILISLLNTLIVAIVSRGKGFQEFGTFEH